MPEQDWRILIVEDNYDDLQVVLTILEYYGIQAMGVESLAECLNLLEDFQPSAIVTDLAMPHSDGWDVLAALRGSASTRHIPVAAMTAYHSDKLAQQVYEGGFDAYFPKPLAPESFIEGLRGIVRD